jgi:Tol biopolymer transport system component
MHPHRVIRTSARLLAAKLCRSAACQRYVALRTICLLGILATLLVACRSPLMPIERSAVQHVVNESSATATSAPPDRTPTAQARHPTTGDTALSSQIVYVQAMNRAVGEYDLYLIQPDGSQDRQLTSLPGVELDPAWSPDGKTLAFTGTQASDNPADCVSGYVEFRCNFDIYTVTADGRDVQRLTTSPAYESDPAWSPDGQQIVFSSRDVGAPHGALVVMQRDGSQRKQLTNGSFSVLTPTWSPDGQQIAFTFTDRERSDIYVIAADGSGLTRLTQQNMLNANPAWSPDGRSIAWVSVVGNARSYQGVLSVMRADGSKQVAVTTSILVHPGYRPAWSPDGKQLAFVWQEAYGIMRINLDGTNLTLVTSPRVMASAPAWSPWVEATK